MIKKEILNTPWKTKIVVYDGKNRQYRLIFPCFYGNPLEANPMRNYYTNTKGQISLSPGEVVTSMADKMKYHFESFSADKASFDHKFTDFVNSKFDGGWDYKECYYDAEGDTRYAFCLFKSIG